MSIEKFYQTEEWKTKSKEYSEGRLCEWCGRYTGDIVTVGERRIKLRISVHHREKLKLGLRAYKSLATAHFKDYFKGDSHQEEYDELHKSARGRLIEGAEEKDVKKRLRFLWDQRHRDELDEIYRNYRESLREWYMNLTPETVIILCNRCHYARHRGLVLCKKCKLRYHKPRFDMCYTCYKELKFVLEEKVDV